MADYSVVNLTQGSPEWRDWRQQGITATDAVVIAGASPYKSLWRLWAEKTGFASPEDISNNPNVKRGNALENKIRAEWEAQTGEMLLPVCIESARSPILRASLDGVSDDGGPSADGCPVEIKAPSEKVWAEIEEQGEQSAAFKMYWVQVQFQLCVLIAPGGNLVLGKEEADGSITTMSFYITRDSAFCKHLLQKSAVFWKQVQTRSAPEKDPVLDHFIPEGEDAERWRQAAAYYQAYQRELDDLNARIKLLKEQQKPLVDTMLGLMGDDYKRGEFAGVMVTQYEQEGNVDYRKIVKDKLSLASAEIDAYRKPSSVRHRVTVTKEEAPRNINDEKVIEESSKPTKVLNDAFF